MTEQVIEKDNQKFFQRKDIKNPLIGVVVFLFLCIIFTVSYFLFAEDEPIIFHFNGDTGLSVTSADQMLNFDLEILAEESKTEIDALFFEYYLEDESGIRIEPETAGWQTVFNTLPDATDRCLRPYEELASLEIRKSSTCTVTDTSFATGNYGMANFRIRAPSDISTFDGYKLVIRYSSTNSIWEAFDDSDNLINNQTTAEGTFEIPIVFTSHGSEEIYLDPETAQFESGTTGDISIKVNTSQDVVAIGADLVIDTDYMEIVSLTSESPAFPVEQNEMIDNSNYRIVLGSYGNGRLGDGTQNPTSANPVGFVGNDEEIAVLRVRFIRETPASTFANIILDNVSFILDNASGDEILPVVGDGQYEIFPENLFSGESIISEEIYCEADDTRLRLKFTASGFDDLRVRINSEPLVAVSSVRNIGSTIKEYEGTFDISQSEGSYSILQDDGTTYLSQDIAYSCLLQKGELKIVDEVATPFSSSAKITFSTIGGSLNGKADGTIVSIIDQDGNARGDWNPDIIEDSLFHDFVVYNLEPENSYEATLRADNVFSGEFDETSIYFTTRESLTERRGNTSLLVNRDRTCNKWLSCNSSVEVVGAKGNKETLCFDIGVCSLLDSDGRCLNPLSMGEEGFFGGNQNYVSPVLAYSQAIGQDPIQRQKTGELAENAFKNLSSYSKTGMDFGNEKTIEGYRHYADMPTIGQDIRIINGDLETGTVWPWEPSGLGLLEVSDDIYSTNLNVSSNVLRIDTNLSEYNSLVTQFSGAKINLGYLSENVDYVLSFDAWTENPGGEELTIQTSRDEGVGRTSYQDLFNENILPFKQRITARINTQIKDGITSLIINKKSGVSTNRDNFSHSFYIDNVSMLPALTYQYDQNGENKIVSRSCRLFPTEDSRACDVLSGSSKKYYGWKGFCVEEDPRNQNLCLNWYPVDVIKGEANAFGSDKQVGYMGRAPLYYCLESTGDASYYKKNLDPTHRQSESIGRPKQFVITEVFSKGYKIHKDQIAEVRWEDVEFSVDGSSNFGDSKVVAVHESNVDDDTSPTQVEEKFGILLFNQDNENYWDVPIRSGRLDSSDSRVSNFSKDGTPTIPLNEGAALRNANSGAANDTFVMTATMIFDDNGYLRQIVMFTNDGNEGDGRMKYSGPYITYLGERCNVIAQVVDPYGKNYARNSRLSDNGWKLDNPLGYEYETDYYPYGAAVPPGPNEENPDIDPNDPDTWPVPLFVMPADKNSGMYAPYQSRAGFPYSIVSSRIATVGSETWSVCSQNQEIRCFRDENCIEGAGDSHYEVGEVNGAGICESSNDDRDIINPSTSSVTSFSGRNCMIDMGADGPAILFKSGVDLSSGEILVGSCYSNSSCPFESANIPAGSSWATSPGENYGAFIQVSAGYYVGQSEGAPDNGTCSVERSETIEIADERPIKSQCIAGLSKKLGQSCKKNSDCGYSDDGSFGLCIGYDFSDDQIIKLSGGYEKGIENLNGLFAKSLGTWKWSLENNKYEPFLLAAWDDTDQRSYPEVKNVIINGRQDDSDDEITYTNTLNTVLEFNTFVKTDQLPLTYYSVDWGDGNITEMNNLKIAPRLDPENPFVMLHSYDKKSCGGIGCQPVITIRDNWDSLTVYNVEINIRRE
jgi:hypothetical protein